MMRVLVVLAVVLIMAVGWYIIAPRTVPSVDGIPCQESGSVTYHVHAFLTIAVRGTLHHPPAGVGIRYERFCLYWLHTHDDSGIIHIEAPHRITPTLGTFFAIWGQPLSAHRIAGFPVRAGEKVRIFVGQNRYRGDPASIPLHRHTVITLEIGPPFVAPVPGIFGDL